MKWGVRVKRRNGWNSAKSVEWSIDSRVARATHYSRASKRDRWWNISRGYYTATYQPDLRVGVTNSPLSSVNRYSRFFFEAAGLQCRWLGSWRVGEVGGTTLVARSPIISSILVSPVTREPGYYRNYVLKASAAGSRRRERLFQGRWPIKPRVFPLDLFVSNGQDSLFELSYEQ